MPNPQEVIRLLSSHEVCIGNLYAEFSKLFTEYEEFWLDCSKDEYTHAETIKRLHALVEQGDVILSGRFNESAIQTSIKYINDQIQKAREGKLSFVESFSMAFSIESSLLENRFFDAFSGDKIEFQKIKQYLTDETQKHKNKVQEEWERNR